MEFLMGIFFGIGGVVVVYELWRRGKFTRYGFLPKPPTQEKKE